MDFGEAVRQFYGNYANPEGRAQRSAFWWVQLYQIIIYVVLGIVIFMADGGDQLLDVIMSRLDGDLDADIGDDFILGPSGIFAILVFFGFAVANLVPNIMLNIRRFHDLGQSGWFVLLFQILGFIPPIGFFAGLINIFWFVYPGTDGPNEYGQDPLGRNTDIFG